MPNYANLCPITFNMKGNNGTMWPLRLPMLFPIATVTNKLPTNYMYMNRGGKCLHQSTCITFCKRAGVMKNGKAVRRLCLCLTLFGDCTDA